jgi:hypothetical protein
MTFAFGPALSRWSRRAIATGRSLIERCRVIAAGLSHSQRTGITVLVIALLAAPADVVVRYALPSGLLALVPALLAIVGSALLLWSSRLWSAPASGAAVLETVAAISASAPVFVPTPIVVPIAIPAADTRPSVAVLDRSIGELGQFPIFTDILTSQMASVVALSDGAAQNIMTGLARVDAEVTTLMSVIRTSDSGVGVGDIVRGIEAKVTDCDALLQHFTARQAETSRLEAALRVQLDAESQAVLRVVDGVRRIAQQSNILSFNIAIEAGHLGNKDNGFAFIADQVRKLAQDVDVLAGRLSGQIGAIMHRVVVESQTLAAERQHAEAADVANLRIALADLDGDFRMLVDHQRDVLAKVTIGSEAVAAPILAMMGSVQFQDITRQQIEQLTLTVDTVGNRIAGIAGGLRDAAEEPDTPDLSQLLDGLFKGYVMDSQRGAHLAAKGNAAPEPEGLLIELF